MKTIRGEVGARLGIRNQACYGEIENDLKSGRIDVEGEERCVRERGMKVVGLKKIVVIRFSHLFATVSLDC